MKRPRKGFPAITVSNASAPLDLTGHAPNCELWGLTVPICTAMAMDPNRKIMFSCTCGEEQRERGERV